MFDLDRFQLEPQTLSQIQPRRCPRSKRGKFLKGPIPVDWLTIAGNLPGKTLHVAIALWLAYGIERQERFRFTPKWHNIFYISPPTLRKSLHRLQEAGLIRLEYRPGCSPIVTLLEAPDLSGDPSDE